MNNGISMRPKRPFVPEWMQGPEPGMQNRKPDQSVGGCSHEGISTGRSLRRQPAGFHGNKYGPFDGASR